jgi:signal transduction histidine kinase
MLRRVLEATLLIESNLELPEVLHHVVEEARSMTGARYGALGVLDEGKQSLTEFVTVGVTEEEASAIGHPPTGRGVLGLLIADPRPLRIADIAEHPESLGFPAHHPKMTSFLGVPIRIRDEVYGNLYLCNKVGWSEFTADDEALVGALSVAAGIAIENARLHARVRRSAVFEDRDRVARDLHDTVIQRLFALGLVLQGIAARLPEGPARKIGESVEEVDHIITQVRSTIYELGMGNETRGARDQVRALTDELRSALGFEVGLTFEGPVDTLLAGPLLEHALAAIREALTNVAKHARATRASVHLTVDPSRCVLVVADDGVGLRDGGPGSGTRPVPGSGGAAGLGLPNLRHRAEKLHGALSIQSAPGGGTVLTWSVPLDA